MLEFVYEYMKEVTCCDVQVLRLTKVFAAKSFPECVAKGSRLTWESEGRAVFAGRCFRVRNRPRLFESAPYGTAVGESSKK